MRISVCHCLDCQRRSGAPFAMQARFPDKQVRITGKAKVWLRMADSGEQADQHFCPDCGSLWYRCRPHRELIAITERLAPNMECYSHGNLHEVAEASDQVEETDESETFAAHGRTTAKRSLPPQDWAGC